MYIELVLKRNVYSQDSQASKSNSNGTAITLVNIIYCKLGKFPWVLNSLYQKYSWRKMISSKIFCCITKFLVKLPQEMPSEDLLRPIALDGHCRQDIWVVLRSFVESPAALCSLNKTKCWCPDTQSFGLRLNSVIVQLVQIMVRRYAPLCEVRTE